MRNYSCTDKSIARLIREIRNRLLYVPGFDCCSLNVLYVLPLLFNFHVVIFLCIHLFVVWNIIIIIIIIIKGPGLF